MSAKPGPTISSPLLSETEEGEATFETLRGILLGDQPRKLEEVREITVNETARLNQLGIDLPRVVGRLSEESAKAEMLGECLRSSVEHSLQRSVKADKGRLTEILAPVMGPAIIGYLADFHRQIVEMLTRFLEEATSMKRWRWRAAALVRGMPYAEYAAEKSAEFRVLALRLMSQPSGRLVKEVLADAQLANLPLLRGASAGRGLAADPLSERQWLVNAMSFTGARCRLDVEVAGVATPELRPKLQEVCHQCDAWLAAKMAPELTQETLEMELGEILQTGLLEKRFAEAPHHHQFMQRMASLVLLLTASFLVGGWAWSSLRWNRLLAHLNSQPGITVLESNQSWGKHELRGLRDPLAKDPVDVLREAGWAPEKFSLNFIAYESLDPTLHNRREAALKAAQLLQEKTTEDRLAKLREEDRRLAQSQLEAGLADARLDTLRVALDLPPAVKIELRNGLLTASGPLEEPSYSRLVAASQRVRGVNEVNSKGLTDLTGKSIAALSHEIASTDILFFSGTLTLRETEEQKISRLTEACQKLQTLAAMKEKQVKLQLAAAPLMGDNQEPNREVDSRRLVMVTNLFAARGLEVEPMPVPPATTVQRPPGVEARPRVGLHLEVSLVPIQD